MFFSSGAPSLASRVCWPGPEPSPTQCRTFFQHMGRHPTILDIRGGIRYRIPLRISPERSNPLNLNFFSTIFWIKNYKKSVSGRKKTPLRGTQQLPWRAWSQILPIRGPRGPCGGFWEQFRPIMGPRGPMWPLWGKILLHTGPNGAHGGKLFRGHQGLLFAIVNTK